MEQPELGAVLHWSMTHAHRHFSWAPRLVPATLASLVSLFAIAPAETLVNRLLHAPHPHVATTQSPDTAPDIVITTHHGPHENPAMRLQRYAYKPHQPRAADEPGACAEPCFDPDAFEPASGGVAGGDDGARPSGFDGHDEPRHGDRFDPPSSPSHEAQFDTAGIGEFSERGHGGGGHGGGGHGGGSHGGGGSDGDGTSFVLLPGAGLPGGEQTPGGNNPGGAGGSDGESSSTPGNDRRGTAGGGGSGGAPGFANGGGGSTDDTGEEEPTEVETISLRVAPAVDPVEVSAPASASLLAAAFALLAWRRRAL